MVGYLIRKTQIHDFHTRNKVKVLIAICAFSSFKIKKNQWLIQSKSYKQCIKTQYANEYINLTQDISASNSSLPFLIAINGDVS